MQDLYEIVIKGTSISCGVDINDNVKIKVDHLFCISRQGIIIDIIDPIGVDQQRYQEVLKEYREKGKCKELSGDQVILPGFIDLHIHAPQFAQLGTALDIPLYDWLNKYTFPLESKFSDENFARQVYQDLVSQLISNGTTTALYFATIHKSTSCLLAEICEKKGQRALVGKVVMDDVNQNPEYYRDSSTDQAINDTEEFIQKLLAIGSKSHQGIYPVITPRFIPSCTDEALSRLGQLAKKYNLYIQSHCSESDWEHQFVLDRFKISDTQALDSFGLLSNKSIMAHCGHLSDGDMDLFHKRGAAVSHCPLSNSFFGNAVTPIRKLIEKQVNIGLGTDISGGYSSSIYDNIKQSVISSRMLEDGTNKDLLPNVRGVPNSRITLSQAFYLATAGGGESLSLPIGRLEINYAFDCQIIDTTLNYLSQSSYFGKEESNYENLFQRIMYLSKPNNISEVWIQGKLVFNKK
ncbi:hypothetical protein CYY_009895 [Polysphondylium violaceum]|uniref:Guanine deaminase n=1 Tax=Polysphondylium violaceum TaxID=133409 RepID=A0A8J4PLI3_9MYCE|nr:hypothetical protein CYY_009895 [Polysphondylium violaceum]